MAGRNPVDAAGAIARRILRERSRPGSPVAVLVRLTRDFADFEFDVPNTADADGFIFQYGAANWFSEPTFVLSIGRQFEVVDADGQYEHFLQVHFEFRYPLDDALEAARDHAEWWFPEDGPSFDSWLENIESSPIAAITALREPRDLVVVEDRT
ncbi:hypothetical protein [Actinomadura roseirufa]|uniref:hypothetical protein n=1 Tax=Actinomadura roseirufa TaxID=2094049 RepID=UPI001041B747|nr:hypothetical protein [Actinomadura roseirufa]